MNKEMIISSNGHETRVAILEDDLLAEIFVERERNRGVVGNVYKGRVSKVLPGMQSAFVDIGLERDGFLYVSDVIANLDEFDKDEDDGRGAGGQRRRRRRRRGHGGVAAAAERARRSGAAAARGRDRDEGRSARPSRRSRSCSRKARTSSSRWPRSRSAPRAPGSPAT